MSENPAQRALTASTVALAVAVACFAMFLPPLAGHTVSSVLRIVLVAMVMGGALLLHCVFLGIAARRLQRSAGGWVGLAVLLFPIGSAAALIMLSWFSDEAPTPAAAQRG
jgi:hypothetical protein